MKWYEIAKNLKRDKEEEQEKDIIEEIEKKVYAAALQPEKSSHNARLAIEVLKARSPNFSGDTKYISPEEYAKEMSNIFGDGDGKKE